MAWPRFIKIFNTKKIFLALLFLFLVSCSFFANNNHNPYLQINNNTIKLELAKTAEDRYLGLSFRDSLCSDCGMLFISSKKQEKSFVMRDMLIPLDIVWIADDEIVKIDHNLNPEGHEPNKAYKSPFPLQYVLELNGGYSKEIGIEVGDSVKFFIE